MNIMMIGMLSLISNPLVHSTCTASLLLFALFLPRLIYRNLFPARRRRRWSRRRKPEKWRVHPGKGGGLSFSPSLRKERTEGTTEVEMGPKLVPPPFPPRSVGWAYKRANRVLAKRLRSASSRVFCSVRLFPEICFPPNFVSWPVWEPVLRKGSWGRLNETAMQRPLLTDLKCKFMKEGTNLVLDLVGLVE